jgi:O-antigen/teichoic acid export membrane protein
MANALNLQGAVLVIGAVLGPAAVVPFATLRTLTRIVQQVLQTASTIVRPEIGIAAGRDDRDMMRRLNRYASRLSIWLALIAAAALLVVGDPLVAAWTGGRVAVEQPLFALLLAVMVANAVWRASSWTLQAVNRVTRQAVALLVVNALALAAMVPLTPALGLAGPAIALLVADFAMAAYLIVATLAFLGETPGRFLRAMLVPPYELCGWLWGRRSADRTRR